MKPLSKSLPPLMAKTFERKYIALGRIVTHWKEIVGQEYAVCAQPSKIQYFKPKAAGEKPWATLEIVASSATCAGLVYRKDIILDLLENLFGDRWISDIRFVHKEPKRTPLPPKRTKTLTTDEKNHLSQILETVADPEIKECLARLGQSIIQEKKP